MITLSCKKLEAKHDTVTISAPGVPQVTRGWKQNILPHEPVHLGKKVTVTMPE